MPTTAELRVHRPRTMSSSSHHAGAAPLLPSPLSSRNPPAADAAAGPRAAAHPSTPAAATIAVPLPSQTPDDPSGSSATGHAGPMSPASRQRIRAMPSSRSNDRLDRLAMSFTVSDLHSYTSVVENARQAKNALWKCEPNAFWPAWHDVLQHQLIPPHLISQAPAPPITSPQQFPAALPATLPRIRPSAHSLRSDPDSLRSHRESPELALVLETRGKDQDAGPAADQPQDRSARQRSIRQLSQDDHPAPAPQHPPQHLPVLHQLLQNQPLSVSPQLLPQSQGALPHHLLQSLLGISVTLSPSVQPLQQSSVGGQQGGQSGPAAQQQSQAQQQQQLSPLHQPQPSVPQQSPLAHPFAHRATSPVRGAVRANPALMASPVLAPLPVAMMDMRSPSPMFMLEDDDAAESDSSASSSARSINKMEAALTGSNIKPRSRRFRNSLQISIAHPAAATFGSGTTQSGATPNSALSHTRSKSPMRGQAPTTPASPGSDVSFRGAPGGFNRSRSDGDLSEYLKGYSELKSSLQMAKATCDNEIQKIVRELDDHIERHIRSAMLSDPRAAATSAPLDIRADARHSSDPYASASSQQHAHTHPHLPLATQAPALPMSPRRPSIQSPAHSPSPPPSGYHVSVHPPTTPRERKLSDASATSFAGGATASTGGAEGFASSVHQQKPPLPVLGSSVYSSPSASSLRNASTPGLPTQTSSTPPQRRALSLRLTEDVRPGTHFSTDEGSQDSPFTVAIKDLIGVAENILDMDVSTLMTPGTCRTIIGHIQELQYRWRQNPDWPLAEIVVRMLIVFASVARLLEHLEEDTRMWMYTTGQSGPGSQAKLVTSTLASRGRRPSHGTAFIVPQRLVVRRDSASSNLSSGTGVDSSDADIDEENNDSEAGREGAARRMRVRKSRMRSARPFLQLVGKHEKQEKWSLSELRAAADEGQSLNVLLEVADDGSLTYISPSSRTVFGYDSAALVGLAALPFLAASERSVFTDASRAAPAEDGHIIEMGFSAVRADGRVLRLEAKGMVNVDRTTGRKRSTVWVTRPIGLKGEPWEDALYGTSSAGGGAAVGSATASSAAATASDGAMMPASPPHHRHRDTDAHSYSSQDFIGPPSARLVAPGFRFIPSSPATPSVSEAHMPHGSSTASLTTSHSHTQSHYPLHQQLHQSNTSGDSVLLSEAGSLAGPTATMATTTAAQQAAQQQSSMLLPPPCIPDEPIPVIDLALCNICERSVPAIIFEEHADLCTQVHKTEMDVVLANDQLKNFRAQCGEKVALLQEEIDDERKEMMAKAQQQQQQQAGEKPVPTAASESGAAAAGDTVENRDRLVYLEHLSKLVAIGRNIMAVIDETLAIPIPKAEDPGIAPRDMCDGDAGQGSKNREFDVSMDVFVVDLLEQSLYVDSVAPSRRESRWSSPLAGVPAGATSSVGSSPAVATPAAAPTAEASEFGHLLSWECPDEAEFYPSGRLLSSLMTGGEDGSSPGAGAAASKGLIVDEVVVSLALAIRQIGVDTAACLQNKIRAVQRLREDVVDYRTIILREEEIKIEIGIQTGTLALPGAEPPLALQDSRVGESQDLGDVVVRDHQSTTSASAAASSDEDGEQQSQQQQQQLQQQPQQQAESCQPCDSHPVQDEAPPPAVPCPIPHGSLPAPRPPPIPIVALDSMQASLSSSAGSGHIGGLRSPLLPHGPRSPLHASMTRDAAHSFTSGYSSAGSTRHQSPLATPSMDRKSVAHHHAPGQPGASRAGHRAASLHIDTGTSDGAGALSGSPGIASDTSGSTPGSGASGPGSADAPDAVRTKSKRGKLGAALNIRTTSTGSDSADSGFVRSRKSGLRHPRMVAGSGDKALDVEAIRSPVIQSPGLTSQAVRMYGSPAPSLSMPGHMLPHPHGLHVANSSSSGGGGGTSGVVPSPSFSAQMSAMFMTSQSPPTSVPSSPNAAMTPSSFMLPAPAVQRSIPSIKDYEIIKPISKGAFGSVYLAKKRVTGDYFAIKVIRKADMVAKNQVMNIKSERMILTQLDSPYVVKVYFSFQSKEHIYLVMEYLNGGDCAALLKNFGQLDEAWTRQYIAEVVLGLEFLHSRDIVHR
nr:hypothetical protein HK105_008006 [Polyrhizophydium stewartii]